MPNSVFVMDGFHLEKHFKKLFRLKGASCYAGVIKKAVKENDLDSFIRFCTSIEEKQDDRGKRLSPTSSTTFGTTGILSSNAQKAFIPEAAPNPL